MDNEYKLSQKQLMLGFALKAKNISKAGTLNIIMVLENDEQIDDMTWYISQNPEADEKQLIAVAYQIVKDAHAEK